MSNESDFLQGHKHIKTYTIRMNYLDRQIDSRSVLFYVTVLHEESSYDNISTREMVQFGPD